MRVSGENAVALTDDGSEEAFRELVEAGSRTNPEMYCAGYATCPPMITKVVRVPYAAHDFLAALLHVLTKYRAHVWGVAWGYRSECPECPVLTVNVKSDADAACVRDAIVEDGVPLDMFNVDDRPLQF